MGNNEFECADIPAIDPHNNRETELAKIEAYREKHPELLAMAKLYDAPEVRRTLSDIEMIEDTSLRQSLLKSLFLGLAGDPGSCDRLVLHYLSRKLADTETHAQADFWLGKMKSILESRESDSPILKTIRSYRDGRLYASLKTDYGIEDVVVRAGTQLILRFNETFSIGKDTEAELAQVLATVLHQPIRILDVHRERRLMFLSWAG